MTDSSIQYRSLRAKGVRTLDFWPGLMQEFVAELERAEAIMLELQHEKQKAAALARFGAAVLETAAHAPGTAQADSPHQDR